ncbi:MAG TPA: hypothetical protein VGK74_26590 [Symbiobacteriaceae bacterium]
MNEEQLHDQFGAEAETQAVAVSAMSCPTTVSEDVCIEATVTITPTVTSGPPLVLCRGPLRLGRCPGTPSPTGTCNFSVQQNLCVEVPLTFDASVFATPGRVVCGAPLPVACPLRCIRICGVIVQGAQSSDVRFAQDINTARTVFAQCGIDVTPGPLITINAPNLLDLDDRPCNLGQTPTADQVQLFSNRPPGCTSMDIVAYYVRSLRSTFNGCAAFPPGLPGFVVDNVATGLVFAHETGHVLGLVHVANPANLMNPIVFQGNLTPAQCTTIQSNSLVSGC